VGKTLLDVGANNGYFSVEASRRGAGRVLALERGGWDGAGFQQFDLVRRHLGPAIEAVYCDVMHLRSVALGTFDVVLFLGVLYHLRHPLYALEMLAETTREQLVVETHIDADDQPRPAMVFYPSDELAGDASNWWGPNVPCVCAMLRTVGFRRVEYSPHPRAPDRGFFHAFK
jgi:tRNA (mo5U34)-methyltransferase